MKFGGEVKLVGDSYCGGYSAGMTMGESGTMSDMKTVRDDDNITEYLSSRGIRMTVEHRKKAIGKINSVNRKEEEKAGAFVTESATSIKNEGTEPVMLEYISSFAIYGIAFDKIHRIRSNWSAEGRLCSETVKELHMEKSWAPHAVRVEKFGTVGPMPNRKFYPFLALENSETGEITGIQLYNSSSWQMEMRCRAEDTFTVAGGIADGDFGHWKKMLLPGEEFVCPKAVIATGRSLYDVCDLLVNAQNPDISKVDDDMGIAFNEYCTTWGNPSFENIKKIVNRIKGKGIKYLVIDCGWFGNPELQWWQRTGDWEVLADSFPNGIKEAADYIRDNGMIPGLWFEFENVSNLIDVTERIRKFEKTEFKKTEFKKTELKRPELNNPDGNAMPAAGGEVPCRVPEDYYLHKDGYVLTVGDRKFLDMENPVVNEYLADSVIKTLKDNGFGYVKVDYNDTIGTGVDGPKECRGTGYSGGTEYSNGTVYFDGPGENLRRKVECSREFFKKMKREIPELVIENCSSGGHRLVPAFMEISSQASFSDAHEITAIPIIAAALHRVIKPSQSQIWAVMRKEDSEARIYYTVCSTFLGRMCLSGDIYDLSERQWQLVEEGMEFYRKAAGIIKSGKTELISTDSDSFDKPQGSQLVIRKLECGPAGPGQRCDLDGAVKECDSDGVAQKCDSVENLQRSNACELWIFHRFENSKSLAGAYPEYAGKLDEMKASGRIAAHYGCADVDFSAEAYIIQ